MTALVARASRVSPLVVLAALLAITALLLAYLGRGTIFFYDEWTFVLERRGGGIESFLRPHNEHLSLIPAAVYKLLLATVGLDGYPVYRSLLLLMHLGVGALVYLLARRRVGPWAALLAVVPVLFMGRAWENLLWAFQIGFVGSVLGALGAMVALDRDDRAGDLAASALLIFSLACSSIGIPFVAGVVVELLAGRRGRRLMTVVALPILLYGVWYVGYGTSNLRTENMWWGLEWAMDCFAVSVGTVFGQDVSWGHPLAVAAIMGLVWALARPGAVTPRLAGLVVAGMIFWVLTGIARAGVTPADTPRYLYIGVVVIVLAACDLVRGRIVAPRVIAIGAAVVTLGTLLGANELRNGSKYLRDTSAIVAAELGAVELLGDRAPADLRVDLRLAPPLLAGLYLKAMREIGDSPATPVADLPRVGGEPRFWADSVLVRGAGITVEPAAEGLPTAPAPPAVDRGAPPPSRGGCLTATGQTTLDLTLPASGVVVRSVVSGKVAARRFSETFQNPGGVLPGLIPGSPIAIRAPADRSPVPWHVRLETTAGLTACALAG